MVSRKWPYWAEAIVFKPEEYIIAAADQGRVELVEKHLSEGSVEKERLMVASIIASRKSHFEIFRLLIGKLSGVEKKELIEHLKKEIRETGTKYVSSNIEVTIRMKKEMRGCEGMKRAVEMLTG